MQFGFPGRLPGIVRLRTNWDGAWLLCDPPRKETRSKIGLVVNGAANPSQSSPRRAKNGPKEETWEDILPDVLFGFRSRTWR